MKKTKKTSKLLALLLAFVMVLGLAAPAFAAEQKPIATDAPENTKIIVHKVKLDNLEGMPKPADGDKYDGTEIANLNEWFAGKNPTPMKGVAFKIFKIGDGGAETAYNGGWVYLTEEDGTIDVTLPAGTYKFVESKEDSTYVGADGQTLSDQTAVPFTITLPMVHQNGNYFDETHPLHVYPKNTEVGKPDNDKKLDPTAPTNVADNSVKLGDVVPYEVTTTIKEGSTYKMVAWNDKMSAGLTFNNNVTISSNLDLGLASDDYDLTYADNGFVLKFKDSGLIKLAKKTAPAKDQSFLGETFTGGNTPVVFTLKYSATVNNDAIVENPLENTNTFHYGNVPGFTPEPGDFTPPPVTPKEEKITVNKSFVDGTAANGTPQEWSAGLVVNLKLQVYDPTTNAWTDVSGQTAQLNNGHQSHTFEGLNNNKVYKVVETAITGWTPNYAIDENGNVVIKNKKNPNPTPITPDPVTVRTGGEKFLKYTMKDGQKEGLANAVFVIKQGGKYLKAKPQADMAAAEAAYKQAEAAYLEAVNTYNALSAEQQTPQALQAVAAAKALRDEKFKAMKAQWEFTDNKADAYRLISDKDGKFEITGLDFGTYQLEEIQAPAGFANLQNDVGFTVTATSYNDTQKIEIENKKVTIPQTGGIGTAIFVVAGMVVMGGAALAMKKNKNEEA